MECKKPADGFEKGDRVFVEPYGWGAVLGSRYLWGGKEEVELRIKWDRGSGDRLNFKSRDQLLCEC